jgi:pyruvate-formate lyase-activating enzyme
MDHPEEQDLYLLYITDGCNLACPICDAKFNGKEGPSDISAKDLNQIIKKNPRKRFLLCGAEPTTRTDLTEIVKILKSRQDSVILYTNGLNLNNEIFLSELKKAGVSKILLSFDGFHEKAYEILRGGKLLDRKLKILELLKRTNTPTTLSVTVLRDINTDQIKKIFDYAISNENISDLVFQTYLLAGKAKDYFPQSSLMSDEVIDILEEQTQGAVRRRSILLSQKLFYAYMSFLSRRACFSSQSFWVFRGNDGGFISIDKLLDLGSVESKINRYSRLFSKNKLIARLYFIFILMVLVKNLILKYPGIFGKLASIIFYHMLNKREYAGINNKFLQIIFTTCCDLEKMDFKITDYCNSGMIWKDARDGMECVDGRWSYLLKKEN